MSTPTPSNSRTDRIDSVGGRILYRVIGAIALLPAVAALGFGLWALSADQWVGGGLLLAFAAGMTALARYCFSADRRLSETAWWT